MAREHILEIAKQYLKRVKASGPENIMAICPFHRKTDGNEERNGSFAMNVMNGLCFCHACHYSGNLYTFLRDVGIPRHVIDAQYQALIDEAGRAQSARPDPLNPIEPTKELLPEALLGTFMLCPQELIDEGYPEELLQHFDIGYDSLHERITFPLRDSLGRLIGISGRATKDRQHPRYKVYDKEYLDWGMPERRTEKRALLWNVHNVRAQLAHAVDPGERYVVGVEGFKACLRLLQAGISNTVAFLGSYISHEQQWLLQSLDVPVYLMFDNDEAGETAKIEQGRELQKTIQGVHIVEYNAAQPSDLNESQILEALLGAQHFTPWFLQQVIAVISQPDFN